MTRHLADHQTPSRGARLVRFLAIDRSRSDAVWHPIARHPNPVTGNRRLVEFLRIARAAVA